MASHTPQFPDISAIIIARNEEGNIGEAVSAVLRGLEHARAAGILRSYEILLVDSASTDRTVEVASQYPIGIIRLRRGWPLSASAGRAAGARLSAGRFLLFVDGDYFLSETWLPIALPLLDRSAVAAVCGTHLEEITGTTILRRRWAEQQGTPKETIDEVDSAPLGVFRREAYEAVGGFHPYLRGGEDRDLGLRLQDAGWRILETAEPMGVHRFAPWNSSTIYFDYYRSVAVWSLGDGQVCRARWRARAMRRKLIRRYANGRFLINDFLFLSFTAILLLNIAGVLASGITGWFAIAADFLTLGLLEVLRRRRHWTWREALFELQGALYGPFRQVAFMAGFFVRTPPARSYPSDVETLRPPTLFGA